MIFAVTGIAVFAAMPVLTEKTVFGYRERGAYYEKIRSQSIQGGDLGKMGQD